MKALYSIIPCAILLAAGVASASSGHLEKLGDQGSCGGGCVDTWLVDCRSTKTIRIEARVRDLIDGRPNVFAVTTMGFTGTKLPQLGQSDREFSGSESTTLSIPAFFNRPGSAGGRTKALVLISDGLAEVGNGYFVQFVCRAGDGSESGQPSVKLLQDR